MSRNWDEEVAAPFRRLSFFAILFAFLLGSMSVNAAATVCPPSENCTPAEVIFAVTDLNHLGHDNSCTGGAGALVPLDRDLSPSLDILAVDAPLETFITGSSQVRIVAYDGVCDIRVDTELTLVPGWKLTKFDPQLKPIVGHFSIGQAW